MTASTCPSDEVLNRAIALGDAGGGDPWLEAHIESCAACQARLEQLTRNIDSDDSLSRALSVASPSSVRLIETIDEISTRGMADVGRLDLRYEDLKRWIQSSEPDGQETLDGFTLLECVGRGGMGVVFQAVDPGNDRVVALKAMLPDLARDPRARDRFLREAKAMAAVVHPNVVALHAVSEVDGLPYLVMEHVEGASLEDRLWDDTPMEADEIVRIGTAVASAMEACHAKGVIHRDIKPSNVLICAADGAVKITDFGLAAVASTPALTHHGYLSGTPDYVAPERLTIGTEADERSDLFSLGCLLYTMATGKAPFGGDTPLITLHRIASEQPPLVGALNPSIPPQLERAIAALMAKKPQDRPASATEARAMLLGEGAETRAKPGPMRIVAAFLAAAAIVALAGLLFTVLRPGLTPGEAPMAPGEVPSTPVMTAPVDRIVVTTAAELETAVATAPSESWIEIDTDATLVVPPLFVARRSLTLAAAEGRSPTIRLRDSNDEAAPEYLLRLFYGSLRLVGLRFQDAFDTDDQLSRVGGHRSVAEQFVLVHLVDADLHAEDCRFETTTLGAGLRFDPGNDALLVNCDVLAPNGTAVSWNAIEGDGIDFDGGLLVGRVGMQAVVDGAADMIWDGVTVVADKSVLDFEPQSGRLNAIVRDSILQSEEALVTATLEAPSLNRFKRVIGWDGERNRGMSNAVYFADRGYAPTWSREVGTWALGTTDSTFGEPLFRLPHDELVAAIVRGESIGGLLLPVE
ncbi:MAG: serine/threonine-protein kinase [Planctomycetota bacterium]